MPGLLVSQRLVEYVLLLSHHLWCSTSISWSFCCLDGSGEWHRWTGTKRTNSYSGAAIGCSHKATTEGGHTCCNGRLLQNNKWYIWNFKYEKTTFTCNWLAALLRSPARIFAIGGVGETRTGWIDPLKGRETDSTAAGEMCTDSSLRFILNPAVGHCLDSRLHKKSNHFSEGFRHFSSIDWIWRFVLILTFWHTHFTAASVAWTTDRLFN